MDEGKRKYRLLIVNDDHRYRESACLLLGREEYDIEEAGDARSAKERLSGRPFHLCLLDSQMPDDAGEMQNDTGLKITKWMKKNCYYTSRVILTTFERIEFVKRAIDERLVHEYCSKVDVARGHVSKSAELVAETLERRLVTLSAKNGLPLSVDALDLWDEFGVVERELNEGGNGVVSFKLGSVMADIGRAADVTRIRAGKRVVGRAVLAGEIEVIPTEQTV